MKAVLFRAPFQFSLEERPVPRAGPNDIVVQVKAVGVCGSDLHGYRRGFWVEPGEVMGHEWAGEIVELGANVRHLQPGQRVTIGDTGGLGGGARKGVGYGLPGAYAEYVRIPDASSLGRVGVIPEGMSYEEAAALEPLRCGLHAARLASPDIGDWAVVIGMGPIGLSCLQGLQCLGSCRVIAVDTSDLRLELAKSLGALMIINAKMEDALARVKDVVGEGHYGWGAQSAGHWSRGARADVVIEAAGKPATLPMALEMVRHGGTVVQIALFEEPVVLDPTIITQKNIRLQGCAGSLGYQRTIDLVMSEQVKVGPMITHRYSLERIVEAFETQMRPDVSGKVIILPGMS